VDGVGVRRHRACSRPAHHLPGGDQLGRHVGQLELQRLEAGERLAELLALVQVGTRRVQRTLRRADRAGGDVDAPAVEPPHRDAKALAFAAQQVVGGHAHVVEAMVRVGWLFQPILCSFLP
jgi:hypothetical protein